MGIEIAQTGLVFSALSMIVIAIFQDVKNEMFRAFWLGALSASVGAIVIGLLICIWSN